jgi:hypothetical protein
MMAAIQGALFVLIMLANFTPFAAELMPHSDAQGKAIQLLVVKATLDFQGRVASQDKRVGIFRGDVDWSEIGYPQAIQHESDLVPYKPLTDVIVNGFAHAPQGMPVHEFEAGIVVAGRAQRMRVFGKRCWRTKMGVFASIELVERTARVPLIYPLAFGGIVSNETGGTSIDKPDAFYMGNPTGTGFTEQLIANGVALPQIEWTDELISSPSDRPMPAGLGCFGRTWQPRMQWLGSYTKEELEPKGLISKLPANFNPRAWNCANPRMQFGPAQIKAGTHIELLQLTPGGQTDIVIPKLGIEIDVLWKGQHRALIPQFDTVIIEPEHQRMVLIWRQAMSLRSDEIEGIKLHVQP